MPKGPDLLHIYCNEVFDKRLDSFNMDYHRHWRAADAEAYTQKDDEAQEQSSASGQEDEGDDPDKPVSPDRLQVLQALSTRSSPVAAARSFFGGDHIPEGGQPSPRSLSPESPPSKKHAAHPPQGGKERPAKPVIWEDADEETPDLKAYFDQFGLNWWQRVAICRTFANNLTAVHRPKNYTKRVYSSSKMQKRLRDWDADEKEQNGIIPRRQHYTLLPRNEPRNINLFLRDKLSNLITPQTYPTLPYTLRRIRILTSCCNSLRGATGTPASPGPRRFPPSRELQMRLRFQLGDRFESTRDRPNFQDFQDSSSGKTFPTHRDEELS
ncbi:hypothetical protein [Miresoil virus 219]|uniref:Uncharacterized protein n=1 Tax=Miresoil virus 219 TaxID=2911456 RepID=A0A9E8YXD8_9VIRU|nr:hypothetical protein [Miresoil virus 219]